jgi:hypothetical protein
MPLKPLPRPLAEPGGALAPHLHDTGLEPASVTCRRPHQQQAAVICSVSQAGCSDGLVRRHPREVSPLSRRVISPEGSTPIRPITGRHSLPPSSFTRRPVGNRLAAGLPRGEGDGLTTFRGHIINGLGSACSPVARQRRQGKGKAPALGHVPFWFKPISIFGLLVLTTFTGSSPELAMPSTLVPDRRDAGSRRDSLAGSPATRFG